MKKVARRVRLHWMALGISLTAIWPGIASARRLVFAETWENGTDAWRTQLANGGDCKGWPTCPFTSGQAGPMFPAALMGNNIFVRDHDGAGGRDAKTCSGRYVNVPRAYAGWDAGNLIVTGGVTQSGVTYQNSQFPVALGDRLCAVAWIRAYDEGGTEAGPYVGITYTGACGVVDAGHDHCTHYMIGPPPGWSQPDPEGGCTWRNKRPPYGGITSVTTDGQWHRYKASFTVNSGDMTDWRNNTPELSNATAISDGFVYGQPRLLLFGAPPERIDTPGGVPAVQHDADFGDVYFYKAEGGEDPCPTEAELDALPWSSDHVECTDNKLCTTGIAPLPATDRSPTYPNNAASVCVGCTAAFGAGPPGPQTCPETAAFCVNPAGLRGGTCKPCSGDSTSGADAAARCSGGAPTCFTEGASFGICGKCKDDTACSAPEHTGPTCDPGSGACFSCTADYGSGVPNACPATAPRCERATGWCNKCQWNDECAGPDHAGPNCHVPSGQCATCASDFGAPGAPTTCLAEFPFCLTAPVGTDPAGVCGRCTSAADCVNAPGKTTHVGTMCDPGTGACGKCDGDRGTSFTAFACIDDALPTCRKDGNCAKCTSDADCVNPTGRKLHTLSRCNPDTGACEGPPADVPKCDGDQGTSTSANACADSAASVCSPDGMCSKCASDTDCLNPPGVKLHSRAVCDPATGSCSQGPEAAVPPPVDDFTMGGQCECSNVPGRPQRAALGALGVLLAAVLVGLRRARRKSPPTT